MLKESKMYIIKNSTVCGYGDEESINIVFYTSDREKAHNYVNKMNAFTKSVKYATELRIKHSMEYNEANPNGAVSQHMCFTKKTQNQHTDTWIFMALLKSGCQNTKHI
jgi:hypothetical protein